MRRLTVETQYTTKYQATNNIHIINNNNTGDAQHVIYIISI